MRNLLLFLTLLLWVGLMSSLPDRLWPDLRRDPDDLVEHAAGSEKADGMAYVAGVFREGRRVGRVTSSVLPSGDGFTLEQETLLALTVLGDAANVASSLEASLASDFRIRSVSMTLASAGTRFVARGEIIDGEFLYELDYGSGAEKGRTPVAGPLYVPAAARAFVLERLEAGRSFAFAVIDPLSWKTDVLEIEVVGRDGDGADAVWHLKEMQRGMTTEVWADANGRILAERGPMGLEMRIEDAAGASVRAARLEPMDVEAATSIVVGEIDQPRTRGDLRLDIAGIPDAVFPRTASQSVEQGELRIRRLDPAEVGTFDLAGFSEPTRALGADDLAASAQLPAQHPRMRVLAQEILAGERDALEAGRLLTNWVFEYLDKVPSLGIPDALTVLDAGRGDCNEHAVLLTTLARAAGIPARLVAGLVYVDGKFVYHAWSEIRGTRGWLPVDPALGQFPADATHVALVYGELDEQAALGQVVGRLRLTVVE